MLCYVMFDEKKYERLRVTFDFFHLASPAEKSIIVGYDAGHLRSLLIS